jgi:hypothetical protein
MAQPGQNGHTVRGFKIIAPSSFGARYDTATTRHTRVATESGEDALVILGNR